MPAHAPSSMPTTPLGAIPDPPLDDEGRLIDEIACRRCGYALRGLRLEGLCPECTTPVGRSIRGDLLQFSDPDWVQRIARGGRLLTTSILLMFVLPGGAMWLVGVRSYIVAALALAIPKAIQVCGFWLATTPDPALGEREGRLSARLLARYGSIVAGGLAIAAMLTDSRFPALLLTGLPAAAMGAPAMQAAAQLLAAAISIASIAALLMYARTLALRVPDDKLWRQCNGVARWVGIFIGARAAISAYAIVGGTRVRGAGSSDLLSAVHSLATFGVIISMIWCISLIFQFRNRLNEAAKRARETWARPLDAPASSDRGNEPPALDKAGRNVERNT